MMVVLTEEWYYDTLARIRVNAFRIELPVQSYEDLHSAAAASVEGNTAVGNCMYMLPSFYNHSCGKNSSFMATHCFHFSSLTKDIPLFSKL